MVHVFKTVKEEVVEEKGYWHRAEAACAVQEEDDVPREEWQLPPHSPRNAWVRRPHWDLGQGLKTP